MAVSPTASLAAADAVDLGDLRDGHRANLGAVEQGHRRQPVAVGETVILLTPLFHPY